MWILINNGEIFEGDEQMLLDCFGITVDQLEVFCNIDLPGSSFTITERNE